MTRRISLYLTILLVLGLLLPLLSTTVLAMNGSGTEGDPYQVSNVTDLQDIADNLTAHYILVHDIDASETATWNDKGEAGIMGFLPIGYVEPDWQHPIADCSDASNWTPYPAAPATYWDKVDDWTDEETTYIYLTNSGNTGWIAFNISGFSVPADAFDIRVSITVIAQLTVPGTAYYKPIIVISGTKYDYMYGQECPSSSYWDQREWTCSVDPSTSTEWTPDGANNIECFGVEVTDNNPIIAFTSMVIIVMYTLPFTGSIDGNGYTISDIYIGNADSIYWGGRHVGLVAAPNGAILEDIDMEDVLVEANDSYSVGGLVGYAYNGTEITDCSVSGDIKPDDAYYTGGVAGYLENSTITNSFASIIHIEGTSSDSVGGLVGGALNSTVGDGCTSGYIILTDQQGNCGGLVGYSFNSDYTGGIAEVGISSGDEIDAAGGFVGYSVYSDYYQCEASGSINATGGAFGGFVGSAGEYDGNDSYEQCLATGDIIAYNFESGRLGGFAGAVSCDEGWASGGTTFTDSYARGDIITDDPTFPDWTYVGGFIGLAGRGVDIENAYSTGDVVTDVGTVTHVGGFIGLRNPTIPGTMTAIFFDYNSAGTIDGVGTGSEAGVTGEPTYTMKTQSTFENAGWDFDNVWGMIYSVNDGYPNLGGPYVDEGMLPVPIIPIVPTPGDEEAAEAHAPNLPWYDLVNPTATGLGWRTIDLWGILIIFIAIGMGVGVMIATGSSMLAAITVGIVLVVGVFMSAFWWWVPIVYAIFAGSYLISVRAM